MQDGWAALALAAYHGHTQIVHILLNAGASPDIQGQV
jgi:ankyrin repeat protein